MAAQDITREDRFGPLGAVITFHRQEQLDHLPTEDDLGTPSRDPAPRQSVFLHI